MVGKPPTNPGTSTSLSTGLKCKANVKGLFGFKVN